MPRPLCEKRNARNLVVHRRPLVGEPVGFEKHAVIAGIHRQRVWCVFLRCIQYTADLVVDKRVRSEVVGVMDIRAGRVAQLLPSPHSLFFRFVVQVVIDIRIPREGVVLITLAVFNRTESWSVRFVVRDYEQEVFVLMLCQKVERPVGDAMAIAVVGRPGRIVAGRQLARAHSIRRRELIEVSSHVVPVLFVPAGGRSSGVEVIRSTQVPLTDERGVNSFVRESLPNGMCGVSQRHAVSPDTVGVRCQSSPDC